MPVLRIMLLCVAVLACVAPAMARAAGTGTGGAIAGAAGPAVSATQAGAASAESLSAAPSTGDIMAADVPYGPLIAVTARRYGISASLFTALVWQESGFDARARSRSGARGLTQLMPATAREMGVRRVYDPVQNLQGGATYLRLQLLRFRSVPLALAAYNAGPGAVVKHRGIPPFAETRKYVRNVLAIEAQLRAAGVR